MRVVLIALLLAGCAQQPSAFDQQMAAMRQHREQQHAEFQQALQRRNEAFSNMLAQRQRAFHARLAQIKQLPLDQQDAALDRLKQDEEAWHRDIQAELDRESRDLDRDQALDAQRDLADAIRDLSDQIEQAQIRY